MLDEGGDVAQLGEHLVRNEGVGGSNPLISTRFFRDRARRGGSGALYPQSAIAGSNSRSRECRRRVIGGG